MEAIVEQRKGEKERERKEKMAKPIDPPPEWELCQCEKIRENIIKEREEAMARYKEDKPKKKGKGKHVKKKAGLWMKLTIEETVSWN